ncbi:MAG: FecR domain-containing protein [Magnetovibrionaceae bacterium]
MDGLNPYDAGDSFQLAQAGGGGEPIGQVSNLTGAVSIKRADGTQVQADESTDIFQGDVVITGPTASVGIVFVDRTTFSLGNEAEMVIDEMIYDPDAQEGSALISVAQGAFTFVSGQIAKTSTDALIIDTPVTTIGVRGTSGAGVAGPEGQPNTFTLLADPDGSVGEVAISNATGVVVMNEPFQTTKISSAFIPPLSPIKISQAAVDAVYGSATEAAPEQPPEEAPQDAAASTEEGPGPEGDLPPEADGAEGEGDGDGDGEAEGEAGPSPEELAAEAEALGVAAEEALGEAEAQGLGADAALAEAEAAAAEEAANAPETDLAEEAAARAFEEAILAGGDLDSAFNNAASVEAQVTEQLSNPAFQEALASGQSPEQALVTATAAPAAGAGNAGSGGDDGAGGGDQGSDGAAGPVTEGPLTGGSGQGELIGGAGNDLLGGGGSSLDLGVPSLASILVPPPPPPPVEIVAPPEPEPDTETVPEAPPTENIINLVSAASVLGLTSLNDIIKGPTSADPNFGASFSLTGVAANGDTYVHSYPASALSLSFTSSGSDILKIQNNSTVGSSAGTTFHMNAGNDQVTVSGSGTDGFIINGGAGNDTLRGGDGNDALSGNSDTNFLDGGGGVDSLFGGTGNDTIFIGTGDLTGAEIINGNTGTDVIQVETSADFDSTAATVTGIEEIKFLGNGSIVLPELYSGVTTLEFNNGTANTLSFNLSSVSTLNLYSGVSVNNFEAGTDAIVITGTSGLDTITGSDAANETITGGSGVDFIDAKAGDDVIILNSGDFGSGESINGGSGTDTVQLFGNADFSSGNVDNIEIIDYQSTASVSAGDWLTSVTTVSGSSGTDTATFSMASTIFDLSSVTFSNFTAGTDSVSVVGTSGADTISTATGGAFVLDGGTGNDTYNLASGNVDKIKLATTPGAIGLDVASTFTGSADLSGSDADVIQLGLSALGFSSSSTIEYEEVAWDGTATILNLSNVNANVIVVTGSTATTLANVQSILAFGNAVGDATSGDAMVVFSDSSSGNAKLAWLDDVANSGGSAVDLVEFSGTSAGDVANLSSSNFEAI